MSINSKVKTPSLKQRKSFPKLMISNSGNVVLMRGPHEGTLLRLKDKSTTDVRVGQHCDGWAMGNFSDFEDDLILSNSREESNE